MSNSDKISPTEGQIVTVKVIGNTNPHHYLESSPFKVIAVSGNSAVVQSLLGYSIGDIETWPIDLHDWYDGSEVFAAMSSDHDLPVSGIISRLMDLEKPETIDDKTTWIHARSAILQALKGARR